MAKKSSDSETKGKYPRVVTPEGRFSYPWLAKPDTGREYSDDKYKTDLLIDKQVWKESGLAKKMKAAVLQVAQEAWPKKGIESLADFKHPFKDMDSVRNCPENMRGCIMIRAKSTYAPIIIGPKKNEDGNFDDLSEKQVAAIKGGDHGRLQVTVLPYNQQGGGVTLALNVVQYKQEGEPLGDGRSKSLESMDEMEVDIDDLEASDDDEAPAKKKAAKAPAKKKAKQVEEEEEEDAEEEEEEEEAPKKRGRPAAKKKAKPVEEEDDEEEEEEEEDDDEPPARKATGRNGAGASVDFEF